MNKKNIDGYISEIKTADVVARYVAGESAYSIAKAYGVSAVNYNRDISTFPILKNILMKSLIMIGLLSIAMVGIGILTAYPLSYIFVGYDIELLELTVSGFKIFALSFLFMGYAICGSGFFTALNDGVTSA